MSSGYLRTPTINGDVVAFISEDDLWSVPVTGGVARRLTASLAEVARPALSPDGKWIAFTSREEHHPEVYVMPAEGGPARRLTWLGATALVRGWLDDRRILFVADPGQPFATLLHAYTVDSTTGKVERLELGPVRDVAYGPDNKVVIGRNTADPARWKRYRGGTAGEIWIDSRGNGSFKPLVQLKGNLASPMWIGDRIWFLSDHEGVGNLYSVRPSGSDLRRHTDHDEYYARAAMTDGTRIVYQHGAELWTFDPDTDESAPIDIELNSARAQRPRRFVPADAFLGGFAVHPAGHSLAIETRGKAFTMALWEEAARQHGQRDGVRYRLATYNSDGESLVAVSDEGGQEVIEVHPLTDAATTPSDVRRLDKLDAGRIVELVPGAGSAAASVALTNHRRELMIVDITTGKAKVVDSSEHRWIGHPSWSSDGQWLAYSKAVNPQTMSIWLYSLANGRTTEITKPEFRDFSPVFDPEGRYLYFTSFRSFDPVYDQLFFDLGFPKAMKPYLVTLAADTASPFVARPRGMGPPAPPEPAAEDDKKPDDKTKAKKSGDEAETPAPKPVKVDLEGIADRIVPFPMAEGLYTQVLPLGDKVLFVTQPSEGSLGVNFMDATPQAKGSIEAYDLVENRHEVLFPGVSHASVSADRQTLVYAAGNRLRAIKAGDKAPEGQDMAPPGRPSGWIDLGRCRVSVDPGSEWHQMAAEAWRLQRDHFWVSDMSGIDWDKVLARYRPLIDKVATRLEFSDLMWELQGELGTSHAYELGGDHRPAPSYAMGHLGADLELVGSRWRITHIAAGDAWVPGHSSPLAGPGLNVAEGSTLLAVNGQVVDADHRPAQYLVHQAGQAVELTIGDSRGRRPRRVVVTTMPDERPARYREWVSANRAYVHAATEGRVGYVHIPDMGPRGYAEFHRAYLSEVDCDALVIDVRFNGGGHVSELILEKLARRRLGFALSRWGGASPYPSDSPAGPLVAITNEQAGSDGDIFTHCFKLLELGPVVGKRTWGGVIGISPSHLLVDGSMTTQPEHSFWFEDVGWGVENYGTDPDYPVEITPGDYAAGRDPQMDKAIDLVTKALRRHRPLAPDVDHRPVLALPELPSRNGTASAKPKARAKPKAKART